MSFLLILLSFISSNTTIYFFVMNYFFFECLYFSEYDIWMLLFIFWLRNRPSIKYVRNWGNGGGHPKCVQVRTGGEGYHTSYARTHLHALTHFTLLWCLGASTVLWCLVLFVEIWPYLHSKTVFLSECLFFSYEINFCCHKINFFTLSCFSKSKLAKTLSILIK